MVFGGLAMVLSACASQSNHHFAGRPSPYDGQADFSSYVAGRFAHQIGDPRAADFLLKAADQDPGNGLLLSRAFLSLLTDGRMQEAVTVAHRLRKVDPENSLGTLLLSLDAFKKAHLKEARQLAGELSSGGLETLIAPILTAWILAEEGKRDEALDALAALIAVPSLRPFGVAQRAYLLDYLKDEHEVESAYLVALQSPEISSLQPVVAYASFLQRHGETAKAVQLVEKYLQAFGNEGLLVRTRARLLAGESVDYAASTAVGGVSLILYRAASELGRGDAHRPAIVYARLASYLAPDLGDARLALAGMLVEAELYSSALLELEKVGKDAALYDAARIQKAFVYQQTGDMEKAVAEIKNYLSERPESARGWAALGDIYRMDSQFDQSILAYDKALSLNVGDGQVQQWFLHFTRGISYERLGRFDAAETELLEALKINPDQPQLLNYLGYSWIDRGINLEEGTRMIQRAVELRPDDGYIIDSLGWAYYLRGEYDEAVESLERAILKEPADPTINDHLGDAYWKVGRRTEARFQWRHALANDPEPEMEAIIKDKLIFGLDLVHTALETSSRD